MIGKGECINCGATVAFNVNKRGRVYITCRGDHDRKACGLTATFGVTDSENLIRKFESEPDDQSERDQTDIEDAIDTGDGDGKTGDDDDGFL